MGISVAYAHVVMPKAGFIPDGKKPLVLGSACDLPTPLPKRFRLGPQPNTLS